MSEIVRSRCLRRTDSADDFAHPTIDVSASGPDWPRGALDRPVRQWRGPMSRSGELVFAVVIVNVSGGALAVARSLAAATRALAIGSLFNSLSRDCGPARFIPIG